MCRERGTAENRDEGGQFYFFLPLFRAGSMPFSTSAWGEYQHLKAASDRWPQDMLPTVYLIDEIPSTTTSLAPAILDKSAPPPPRRHLVRSRCPTAIASLRNIDSQYVGWRAGRRVFDRCINGTPEPYYPPEEVVEWQGEWTANHRELRQSDNLLDRDSMRAAAPLPPLSSLSSSLSHGSGRTAPVNACRPATRPSSAVELPAPILSPSLTVREKSVTAPVSSLHAVSMASPAVPHWSVPWDLLAVSSPASHRTSAAMLRHRPQFVEEETPVQSARRSEMNAMTFPRNGVEARAAAPAVSYEGDDDVAALLRWAEQLGNDDLH